MKKRTLVLLLCIALASLVAVNDTLASTVQDWFQDLTHLLGADGIPDANDAALNVDIVTSTNGVLTPAHYTGDFSWAKAQHGIVKKHTCVQNVENEAAYVRICIAVRNAPGVLHHRLPDVPGAYHHSQRQVTIGGKPFTLYVFDYTGTLAARQESPVITMDFALTKETDNDDLIALGNDFVQVQSFAIQASAFQQLDENGRIIDKDDADVQPMKPKTALEYALGSIESFNPFN